MERQRVLELEASQKASFSSVACPCVDSLLLHPWELV